MFQLTPLVRNLIIINVVVFVLQQIVPVINALVPLNTVGTGGFMPYQFLTYMFAHGGFMHILFNMLTLASFAPILENEWGDKKFLFFYLATGIGAGIIYVAFNHFILPGSAGAVVGASGALFGVLMAFGMLYPNMELQMLFIPVPIKAKYMVFIVGIITYLLDRSGQVSHITHFGGAIVGLIIVSVWKGQGRGRY